VISANKDDRNYSRISAAYLKHLKTKWSDDILLLQFIVHYIQFLNSPQKMVTLDYKIEKPKLEISTW